MNLTYKAQYNLDGEKKKVLIFDDGFSDTYFVVFEDKSYTFLDMYIVENNIIGEMVPINVDIVVEDINDVEDNDEFNNLLHGDKFNKLFHDPNMINLDDFNVDEYLGFGDIDIYELLTQNDAAADMFERMQNVGMDNFIEAVKDVLNEVPEFEMNLDDIDQLILKTLQDLEETTLESLQQAQRNSENPSLINLNIIAILDNEFKHKNSFLLSGLSVPDQIRVRLMAEDRINMAEDRKNPIEINTVWNPIELSNRINVILKDPDAEEDFNTFLETEFDYGAETSELVRAAFDFKYDDEAMNEIQRRVQKIVLEIEDEYNLN